MDCKFSVIILAAGFSSRMGQIKALLPIGDETMIERTISLYQDIDVDDIRVVVGYEKKELLPLLNRLDVAVTDNPNFEEGMFSSVLAGLSDLPSDRDACFIHPVDIPLVKGDTVRFLHDTYLQRPGKILRPSFNGRYGHPPLLPSSIFEAILSWKGEGGLKAALSEFEKISIAKEVTDRHILFDIDTPEDYKKALSELQTG
jgi:molybdenum cofactor cytidylyltransferase